MSVTKQLNSKSNIKQYSDGDLPLQPRFPVIARYSAESTASQTLINLPWSVDTLNSQDSFFLTVDGKTLTLGSANDYTMTNVDSFGLSSQVTLAVAIAAGLNIQAWKLGLKKETQLINYTVIEVSSNVTAIPFTVSLVNTSAPRTITLPSPSRNSTVTIKDSTGSAGANNITISPSSGTVDGGASLIINTNRGYAVLIADGTNWHKIG